MGYQQIMEQKRKLVEKAKDLLAKPASEGRDGLTGEEKTEYSRMKAEIDALQQQATEAHEYETARAEIEALDASTPAPVTQAETRQRERQVLPQSSDLKPDTNRAVKSFLRGLNYDHTPEDIANMRQFGARPGSNSIKLKLPKQRRARTLAEARQRITDLEDAQYRGTDPQTIATAEHGGYAVVAEVMAAYLDMELLAHGAIYPLARKIRTDTGVSLVVPGVDDTTVKAVVVGEGGTTAVSDVTFTDSAISTSKWSSGVQKISLELLQDSSFDITALIGELIGTRFSRGLNEAWTIGDGTNIEGIYQSTSGNGSTALSPAQATANAWAYEELIDLVHAVDSEYRKSPACVFMTQDSEIAKLKKIADDNNRPLWLPSLEAGGNSMFDGFPIVPNPDMPSGSGAIGLGFGDHSRYVIREVAEIEIHMLPELYLVDGYVGIIAFGRFGGGCPGSIGNAIRHKVEHASSS